jgi:DNA-binding helix-hairpin-helix protein with protein kinase domain
VELQRLQSRAQELQLRSFLEQKYISDASIRGIGEGRTQTLLDFGIETAFDIDAGTILDVPGFGPKLTERLVRWRQKVEAKFKFDPAVGVPTQERQALDTKYAKPRQQVEARLRAGEGELRAIVRQAETEMQSWYEHIRSCLQLLDQAELNLSVLPQGVWGVSG